MDNLTHSLTGAVAAKLVGAARQTDSRSLFWLTVVSANLPDVDVALRLVTDPVTALDAHRGVTHSLFAAPILALMPAWVFYRFGSLKNFRLLWFSAWVGILVHIFFDVVTPFGTQIFAPFSTEKYSLDWMFIIDPLFTLLVALGLWGAKRFPRSVRARFAGLTLIVGYLALEGACHTIAQRRVEEYAERRGLNALRVSALPQPLNLFRWMGVVQTDQGVEQAYFSLLEDSLSARSFPDAISPLTAQTRLMPEARWYLGYARHPWVREVRHGDSTTVEFQDLQFAVDPALARRFGLSERNVPFVLRYVYRADGSLAEVRFDRDVLRTPG